MKFYDTLRSHPIMTDQEFKKAVTHQTGVLDQVQTLLRKNKMSISADGGGDIWLCDDGRDIGNTGYLLSKGVRDHG